MVADSLYQILDLDSAVKVVYDLFTCTVKEIKDYLRKLYIFLSVMSLL